MTRLSKLLAAVVLAVAAQGSAQAALFTASYGANVGNGPSNCDDCFAGPFGFSGIGQDINFFGNVYGGLYVGSNGYVTFGTGASNFVSQPLDSQTIAPMIAGSFTDLDSRSDVLSNVYINSATPGQLVATWEMMGHYNQNYTVRSTFQVVVRSDQFAVPAGQGQIGFFYDSMTDPSTTSAGFGDGLAAVNPGEVAFLTLSNGTLLNQNAPRWYILNQGAPEEASVPAPAGLALLGLGLAVLGFRRRSKT